MLKYLESGNKQRLAATFSFVKRGHLLKNG